MSILIQRTTARERTPLFKDTVSLSNLLMPVDFNIDVLLNDLAYLYITRYVFISGTFIILYDTLLMLPDELRLVWSTFFFRSRAKRSLLSAKVAFVLAKLVIITNCIVSLMKMIPPYQWSSRWCQNAEMFDVMAVIIVEILTSGVIVHRLQHLWQFGHFGSLALLGAFCVTGITGVSFSIATIARARDSIFFLSIGNVRTCNIQSTSALRLLIGAWLSAILFDVVALALLVLNALARPRAESQRLLGILYRDGLAFFLTVISMRLLNLAIAAKAEQVSFFLIGIMLEMTVVTTVTSRTLLGLFRFSETASPYIE